MREDTPTVTPEFADQEFERFAQLMDVDIDTSDMDAEDLEDFNKQKKRMIQALVSGALVLNEEGEFTFTPRRSDNTDPITFNEPTGSSILATDKYKKNQDIAKMYAYMAKITKTHSLLFSKMKAGDLKVCNAIATFFLA